jgi:pectate lyase
MSAAGAPIGYAAYETGGTTGGGLKPALVVTNCDQLTRALATDDNSSVVVIDNIAINCAIAGAMVQTCPLTCDSNTGDSKQIFRVLGSHSDCSAFSIPATTPYVYMNRNETTILVKSNKTLIGRGKTATITGATLYLQAGVSNVIVQNLTLQDVNPSLIEAGDAITIDGANHVWVDHCTFRRISDGFVDVVNTVDTILPRDITISWNHFDGSNEYACSKQHNYTNTIENGTVTFHHNLYDHTLGCSPKVSQTSKTHIFNSYWLNVLYYSIQVADTAQATIQGNDFDTSKKPYYGSDSCLTKSPSCAIEVPTLNQFEGISSTESQDTGGTVSALPYDSTTCPIDDKSVVKAEVLAGAGPTLSL